MNNTVKTALLLGALSGAAPADRRGARRRAGAWSSASCSRSSPTSGRTGSRTRSSSACTARRKSGPAIGCHEIVDRLAAACRAAAAALLRDSRRVAERIRDRPQSRARGGRGDRRHSADAHDDELEGVLGARARARQAPRHPDQLGRRDARRRDHDDFALRDVLRRQRRRPRRPRRPNPIALLATIILAPIAAMLIQAAISRSREYRRRCRRRGDRGQPERSGQRAAEDRGGVASRSRSTPTPPRRTCSSSSRSSRSGLLGLVQHASADRSAHRGFSTPVRTG